jgi:hypothetical protein
MMTIGGQDEAGEVDFATFLDSRLVILGRVRRLGVP